MQRKQIITKLENKQGGCPKQLLKCVLPWSTDNLLIQKSNRVDTGAALGQEGKSTQSIFSFLFSSSSFPFPTSGFAGIMAAFTPPPSPHKPETCLTKNVTFLLRKGSWCWVWEWGEAEVNEGEKGKTALWKRKTYQNSLLPIPIKVRHFLS